MKWNILRAAQSSRFDARTNHKTSQVLNPKAINQQSTMADEAAGIKRRPSDSGLQHGKHLQRPVKSFKAKKSVQFSPLIDITFVETYDPNEIDASELWYSDDDTAAMKHANLRAVQTFCLMLSSKSCDPNDDRVIGMMTGLENLIFSSQVQQCRMGCLRAVLDEQERQDDMEIFDPDTLAKTSQQYSTWATRRALQNGSNHSRGSHRSPGIEIEKKEFGGEHEQNALARQIGCSH